MLSNRQGVQVGTANSMGLPDVAAPPSRALGNVHISTDTVLFTGTVPFIWSLDTYLQFLKQPVPRWFITLHITAPGSVTRIFKSATVEIFPDKVCAVPFNDNLSPAGSQCGDNYFMDECEVTGIGSSEHCIYVKMIPGQSPDGGPLISIVNTDIQTNWIIGAREIVLTDPPVVTGCRDKAEVAL